MGAQKHVFAEDYRLMGGVRCHAGSVEIYVSWFDRERQGLSANLTDLAPFKNSQLTAAHTALPAHVA